MKITLFLAALTATLFFNTLLAQEIACDCRNELNYYLNASKKLES
jgi:hypothetical protein